MDDLPPTHANGDSTEPPEEALEFKPGVKITAGALLFIAWVGLCFAFYRLGKQVGYDDALATGMVSKQVNEEAIRNISYFLRLASADDQTLLDTVRNHDKSLSWVKDPQLKREGLGMLLSVLISRGYISEAAPILEEILPPDPASPAWIERMQKTARYYALADDWEQSMHWFRRAECAGQAQDNGIQWKDTLREHAFLLESGGGGSAEKRRETFQKLLDQQKNHAADDAELHAELLVLMGRVQQELGHKDEALALYREAIGSASTAGKTLRCSTLACYGAAYLELGDAENAEKYLRAALERRENGNAQMLALCMCMRDLATYSLSSNQARQALDQLKAARDVATPLIPADSLFWASLSEQHGWALFMSKQYDAAQTEFRSVLESVEGKDKQLRIRPLEGLARCCLALGRVEEAFPAAEECIALRERYYPADKEGLGRVSLLLGQACDQAGHADKAAQAYGRASELLPEGNPDRLMAIVSQAYSLTQTRQWEVAARIWEKALPLIPPDDVAFRERIATQLTNCRRKIDARHEPTQSTQQAQ